MGYEAHSEMFRGASKLTLDTKGRMAMPTRYRELLQARCAGKLVITVDPAISADPDKDKDKCLWIYPLPDWEEVERKVMSLPTFDPLTRGLQRWMVGNAADTEIDGHGRILLPPDLREKCHLTRDAILVGQGLRFEVWDEVRWNESQNAWQASAVPAGELLMNLEKLSL